MARALLVSLALLVGLGVTGLWLATRAPRGERTGITADAAPPTAEPHTPGLPSPRGDGDTRDEALPAPGGSARPAAAALRLVVSSGETGAPLAGARVGWASLERLQAASEARPELAADVEALVEQAGDALLADDHGEARLPQDGAPLRVTVRHGELFTFADLSGRETVPVLLELFTDLTLEVQVQSPAGQALVGVPVVVKGTQPGADELWNGETGADGRARLAHAQVVLAEGLLSGDLAAELGFPLWIRADEPRAVPRTTFGGAPWPSAPLRLVCPPTGALTVRVLDASGEPYLEPAQVELRVLEEERDVEGRPTRPQRFTRAARDGVARFAYVGLGLQLGVRVLPEDELGSVHGVVRGPTHAGEEGALALQLGPRWPVLTGRLLDEHARPLGDRSAVLVLVSAGRALAREQLVTDAEARFRVLVQPHGEAGAPLACEILAAATDTDAPRAGSVGLAQLAHGELALGDIELVQAARIAAGVVLDDALAPVAGANVEALFAELPPDGAHEHWRSGPSVPAAVSASDGRFELRGLPPGPRLRLVAAKRGWSDADPVLARLGAEDVVLRMSQSGSLEGRLLLGAGVTPAQVQVRVLSKRVLASGEELRRSQTGRVDEEGAFVVEGAGPGLVDVEVVLAGMGRQLALVEGVTVPGGQVARDPRLDPLDLTSAVFAYTLRVLDHLRAPVELGHVITSERNRNGARLGFAVVRGLATILCTQRVVDVEVETAGHRTALLQGVDGDREVVLEPAFRIHLRLPDDVALPPAHLVLHVRLVEIGGRPKGDTVQIFSGGASVGWASPHGMEGAGEFGPARELVLPVARPGRHRVVFALSRLGEGDERAHIVPTGLGGAIDVGPDDAERVHLVAPHAAPYAEALRSFDG